MDMSVIKLSIALLLTLTFSSLTVGQSHRDLIAKVREIKLLESTRDDVRRILADFITSESNEYSQDYDNDEVTITVHFSDGICSADTEEDDDEDSIRWNVGEWTVTRIEIVPSNDMAVNDSGFDVTKLQKEQMYNNTPDQYIYHDKPGGVAIETGDDIVGKIIIFPSSSRARKLCQGSTSAGAFYVRESWYSEKLEDRSISILLNLPASVQDLILSTTNIGAVSNRKIVVTTSAVDPENDVLTYVYNVSAGHIVGNGAKVVWDLTGVNSGEHTITAGVDDGTGVVGRTITKMVTVRYSGYAN